MTTPTSYLDTITTTGLPDALRVYFSKQLEFTARPNFIFDQDPWVEMRDDFSVGRGQQVIWTVYHQLAAAIAPLVENTDVLGGSIQDHQVSFTVQEYGNAIGTTEALDLLSYQGPISNIVRTLLGPNQAMSMDRICRNMFYNANNRALTVPGATGPLFHYYTGGAASRPTMLAGSSIISSTTAQTAAYHLTARRIPAIGGQTPSYICLTHPSTIFDLRTDAYWKDAQLYAGATRIFNGEEGMIHGVRFIKSDQARLPNGGGWIGQATLTSAANAGQNFILVNNITNFAIGQEVTLHHAGVSTTATIGGTSETWVAPDGQDPTDEELVISNITGGASPYTITFTNKLELGHLAADYMTEALDVYPLIFMGGLAPLGKGIIVPPEVRVSLPTDKLRRINYVGWYGMLGYGVIRDYAYELVETLATMNTPPVYGF